MWLLWLKIVSIFVVVVSGVVAAYREMHPRKKQSRIPGILLLLSIVFGITAITTEIVGHFMEKEFELQRAADLRYIQALDLPLARVGLDFILGPTTTTGERELQWMFRFDKNLPALGGHFYNVINLHFCPDSGWTLLNKGGHEIDFEGSENHLMVWINDFGIKQRGRMLWQPDRIADLTGLQMQMYLGPHRPPNRLEPDFRCPIQQINVYVNSLEVGNRVATVMPTRRDRYSGFEFYPTVSSPFVNAQSLFYFDPYGLRSSILEALKSRK